MIPVDNHTIKVNVTHDFCMKTQRGLVVVASTVHIIITRRGWVVSTTPWPLYLH
jgi:hypothetical protein